MFQSRKNRFKAELSQAINSSYDKIGSSVVEIIKDESPVISGNLRNSNDYKIEEDGLYIINTADYAAYVELGTYKQSANPFMRRGIVKSVSNIVKIIQETLGVNK